MGVQETKSGKSPQSPQEQFGLVQTDRLIEAVRKSPFLLDPQKEMVIRLVRGISEDLRSIPPAVMPLLIIQRAEERDTAISQNEHLRGENTELRSENQALKQQVRDLEGRLSRIEDEVEESDRVFDGSITEKRIFERMLKVHESFVEDLQLASPDVSCKNEDFDGLELLYLVFDRLLGIDIEQLSSLERREIDWIARDLGYDPDHEVDISPIEHLIASLEQKLEKAREIDGEQPWPELPAKPTEEEGAT